MKVRVTLNQSIYDIYPKGYDLTSVGKRLNFTEHHQSLAQFVDTLFQFDPSTINALSSLQHTSEQIADIVQQLESGTLVVVQPNAPNEERFLSSTKQWLQAGSDYLSAAFNTTTSETTPNRASPPRPQVTTNTPEPSAPSNTEKLKHKLVVEVAGRDLTQQQSIHLAKHQSEQAQCQFAVNDHQRSYRSLVTFNQLSNNPRKLGLAVAMSTPPSPMVLPLFNQAAPCKEDIHKSEWDYLVIPIKPLRYLTDTKDKTNAGLLRDGWLYIFWQGQLWRELEVNANSALRDVRVNWYRNQIDFKIHSPDDRREADGRWLSQVWLPYKVNNQYQLGRNGIRLAFSESQWPWELIETIEANTDKLLEKTTTVDAIQSYSKHKGFTESEGDVTGIESLVDSPNQNDNRLLQPEKRNKIAAVYLTEQQHQFRLKVSKQNLTAWRGKRFQLTVGYTVLEGVVNSEGIIECAVPKQATEAELQVWCADNSEQPTHRVTIELNQLAPIDTIAGVQTRLNNLNHHAGIIDGIAGRQTIAATIAFQAQHQLNVDGIIGPKTRQKLREVYGR